MPALRELQRRFAAGVFGAEEVGTGLPIRAGGLSAARRLQIYRNGVHASFRGALADCYPVVRRLLGEDCFRAVARDYSRGHVSASGNLHDYGAAFPVFLAAHPALGGLSYLADVARLEWLMQEVYHAANAPGLDRAEIAALAAVPADRYGDLRLRLDPAARLLRSDFPVLRIWQANQPGRDGAVHLDEGGDGLLIRRRGEDIEFEALGDGEFTLLAALASGCPVLDAGRRALVRQPDFNLTEALGRRLADGLLIGFQLS